MEPAVSLTGPALDGWRFLWACGIGLVLGMYYGFLRPLRPRHAVISDVLFLPVLAYGWLYLGFAICRGDLRIGYCLGILLGIVAWELTIGRLLRPVFAGVWRGISRICRGLGRIFRSFFQKIQKITKKYLQYRKNRLQ